MMTFICLAISCRLFQSCENCVQTQSRDVWAVVEVINQHRHVKETYKLYL